MAKQRKPNKQAGSIILIVGLALAGLIGLAYLAQNIIGSQATTLSGVLQPTTSSSSTNQSPSSSDENNLGIPLPPKVSPNPACQAELDKVWQRMKTDKAYLALIDILSRLRAQGRSTFWVEWQLRYYLAFMMTRYVACLNDQPTIPSPQTNNSSPIKLTPAYRTR